LRRIRRSLASIDAGGTIIVAERVANRQGSVANLGAFMLLAQRAMVLFRPAILGKLNNVEGNRRQQNHMNHSTFVKDKRGDSPHD